MGEEPYDTLGMVLISLTFTKEVVLLEKLLPSEEDITGLVRVALQKLFARVDRPQCSNAQSVALKHSHDVGIT